MNFFADESLDRQIITRLRQDGHTVLDVTEMDPGISDDKVLSMANESKAILLTADREISAIWYFVRVESLKVLFLSGCPVCLPPKKLSWSQQ
jgi:hypothetical protein